MAIVFTAAQVRAVNSGGELTSLRWWLTERRSTRRAAWRGFWHIILRYDGEICLRCGRRVMPHTGSWWHAPEDLWVTCGGPEHGVLCPPCFTDLAARRGLIVYWEARTREVTR